jgi:hypothetical protein
MSDILIQILSALGGIALGAVLLVLLLGWLGKQPWWPNDGGP